jgi:hypothetical protein
MEDLSYYLAEFGISKEYTFLSKKKIKGVYVSSNLY